MTDPCPAGPLIAAPASATVGPPYVKGVREYRLVSMGTAGPLIELGWREAFFWEQFHGGSTLESARLNCSSTLGWQLTEQGAAQLLAILVSKRLLRIVGEREEHSRTAVTSARATAPIGWVVVGISAGAMGAATWTLALIEAPRIVGGAVRAFAHTTPAFVVALLWLIGALVAHELSHAAAYAAATGRRTRVRLVRRGWFFFFATDVYDGLLVYSRAARSAMALAGPATSACLLVVPLWLTFDDRAPAFVGGAANIALALALIQCLVDFTPLPRTDLTRALEAVSSVEDLWGSVSRFRVARRTGIPPVLPSRALAAYQMAPLIAVMSAFCWFAFLVLGVAGACSLAGLLHF